MRIRSLLSRSSKVFVLFLRRVIKRGTVLDSFFPRLEVQASSSVSGIRSYPQPDASDILNDNKTPIQSGKRGSTCCASFDIPPPLSVIVLCVFSTIPILVTKSTASEKHWHSALADKHAFILSPPHRAARRKSLWCHVSDEKQREEKCQVEQGGHALRDH